MIKLKSLLPEWFKPDVNGGQEFEVGKTYDAGDVYNYILSQHEDFEDDDRVYGTFKCLEMNPQDIEDSEWDVSDHKVKKLMTITQPFPPIVLNKFGWIIDGGHRLAAAKLRGDAKIKVLLQQK